VEPDLLRTSRVPLREFTDTRGKRWTVWATSPDWISGVASSFGAGWLTFESGGVRKRLAPIPANWEAAPVEKLELYCATAESSEARRRNTREIDVPGERR
jgi:hypothetical protein